MQSNEVNPRALTTAVTQFQKMSGLRMSGSLNRETVHKMKEPRCGFPDVVPAEERSNAGPGKRRKRYNTTFFHRWWFTCSITWKVENNTSGLSDREV
ncbi:PREDICTED: interstitial collagenase-like, partial [Priapulus caudatus]|uniref:Interstitial collagenase-like n=1 Tax=Priapulus caudatus TaxID=37621 RepID=A0ABM1F3Z5_PRICU